MIQSKAESTSQLPKKREFASTLQLLARISYWAHLLLGITSGIILSLVVFSRNFSDQTNNIAISFSLVLALVSLVAIGFRVYWALRYRNLAKNLQLANRNLQPNRLEIIRVLRFGLLVSGLGMVLAFVASETAIISIIAKAIAQPQGVVVYNPEKIIRPADLFLVLASLNILGAHFLGSVNSLGLLNWISKE